MKKELEDRIAALKDRQEKTAAKINALQAKAKGEERKKDTRRKIVVGGAILLAMEKDEELARAVRDVLARTVGRPIDRAVIADLLPYKAGSPADEFSQVAESMAS
ncbi:MAG: hypothetical protein P4M05_33635 [Bradyrhizobium sp.]|nr:hypothetical protein [Bradyrhizobium sp.]